MPALAVDPDGAQDLGQVVVIGENGPAVTIAAQRLGREKGGGGHRGEGSGPPALVGGAEGLGRIFQDKEAVALGDGVDAVVIRGLAEEVHRDDASGFKMSGSGVAAQAADGLGQGFGIEIEGLGSISTKTGVAPSSWITSAVAIKVKGVVKMASPGPTP